MSNALLEGTVSTVLKSSVKIVMRITFRGLKDSRVFMF